VRTDMVPKMQSLASLHAGYGFDLIQYAVSSYPPHVLQYRDKNLSRSPWMGVDKALSAQYGVWNMGEVMQVSAGGVVCQISFAYRTND
jgi:hypothetical protein